MSDAGGKELTDGAVNKELTRPFPHEIKIAKRGNTRQLISILMSRKIRKVSAVRFRAMTTTIRTVFIE
jgi:hypothetical protein